MNSADCIENGDRTCRRVLVIGGTGIVGAPIVRQLHQAGWAVRVLCRNPSRAAGRFDPRVELLAGNANRQQDLARAMVDCRAVLICVSDLLDPYLDLRATQNVASSASALGVERVALISGTSVAAERRAFPMIDAKYQAEEQLKASGLPWVIIRPTWVMESLARFVQGKRASILGQQPATIHPVAGADLGRMVCRALEQDAALGHTFTIHGPAAGTQRTWLEAYCKMVAPQASVSSVPLWMLSLIAALTFNRELKAVVALMRYFDAQPEHGDPAEANRILGAPTLTLEQWLTTAVQ